MFENVTSRGPRRGLTKYVAFSVVAHVVLLVWVLHYRVEQKAKQTPVAVVLFRQPPAPPPPPPPAGAPHPPTVGKRIERKKAIVRVKPKPKPIPQPEPVPQVVVQTPPPVTPPATAAAEPGGKPGGVAGGVAGGKVGGVVGAPLKPRNVAAFVIQGQIIRQDPLQLSEVFKESHRGTGPIVGMYRVCVGLDGHVYQVVPVKSVPGADQDIIDGIKQGWVYKPQQVPVCFLYNMPIEIEG